MSDARMKADDEQTNTVTDEDTEHREHQDDVVELPERSVTDDSPLFPGERTSSHRARWDEIQSRFVDDPRSAVQDADELVTTVIAELQESFHSRTETLEAGWQRGDETTSTEELRLALQGYRSFFGRLLDA